jgi:prepilin-type processing-associated H-X9-DG protein
MAHRLLIVQPSYYRSRTDHTVFRVRRRAVVPLTLPYLAALTPPEWAVTLQDEQLQPLDFEASADLVALTAWTLNSRRAYDIADEFRRRRVPVVIGGPHVCFHAEEAGEHCDAVAVGEGESVWPQILEDAARGRLQPRYRVEACASLAGLPFPRYDLLDLRWYGPFRTFTVVGSRGCPFRCEFCSERFLLGEPYRCRPVAEIVAEIRHSGARNVLFGDSNFAGKRSHAMELMEALAPLKVRWSALWPSYLCRDSEFLDLAQRSGLLHVNLGFESMDSETLTGMNKRFNRVSQYGELLANLRRRGLSYSLNFIFGWDHEPADACRSTLEFLERHKVPVAYFNILTPVKGTPLYDRLQAEGRILEAGEIDRWPGQFCHIRLHSGTPQGLENQVAAMYRAFYSWRSMLTRLPWPVTKSHLASWMINLSQRRMTRAAPSPNNFDGY